MEPFEILIIGTDINAYTMARNYHELYGKKANIIGKSEMKFTSYSSITNIMYEPNLWDTEIFKSTLQKYAEGKDKPILLIGTNDFYVRLISENADFLKKWYVFNYPRVDLMDILMKKDSFYENFGHILEVPKTYIYSCREKKLEMNLLYPVVVKPGNGVSYYKHEFVGQNKVFRAEDEVSLKSIIHKIEASGYEDTLIIQEFIPGDDSALFDCMIYCDSKGKASVASFAQIGLQEHTPTGVGNCTVIVNGYNQYGEHDEVIYQLKQFLESIAYTGWAEIDLKYDNRDGKFKVFEINTRQARCSYYVTASGCNLIEMLVDDLIYHKEKEFMILKNKIVMSFVPNSVIYQNVENEKLLTEIKKLVHKKKLYNALQYRDDKSFKRKLYLYLRSLNYKKKYKRKDWWS